MRHINEVIIHATATRPEWGATQTLDWQVNEVRRWHVEDWEWSDIGYHFLIGRTGTVAKGRPVSRVGAHVRGRNNNSIGVALFGGHGGSATDQFSDHYTDAQGVALRRLLGDMQSIYGRDILISGHNQYAAKACPCFNVPLWWGVHRREELERTWWQQIWKAFK